MTKFGTGQTASGIKAEGTNRAGRREIERNGPLVEVPAGKGGVVRGAVILDVVNFSVDTYLTWAFIYDKGKIEDHTDIAYKVAQDMTKALNSGMVPAKYQNNRDISKVMNVILQGVTNPKDKEINNLGIEIFNKYNPQPVTKNSGLDNQPSKTYVKPVKNEE